MSNEEKVAELKRLSTLALKQSDIAFERYQTATEKTKDNLLILMIRAKVLHMDIEKHIITCESEDIDSFNQYLLDLDASLKDKMQQIEKHDKQQN